MRSLSDRSIAILLFFLAISLCFATASGVISTNDGSHYALVRAIAEEQRYDIRSYQWYTGNFDVAFHAGGVFSDRPPGTALLATPFYLLGGTFGAPLAAMRSAPEPGYDGLLAFTLMMPALCIGGVVALFYLMQRRHFEFSQGAAALSALGLISGTTLWLYGSTLYSHAPAALAIMACFYLIQELDQRQNGPLWVALLLGFVLGAAPVIEYQLVIFSGLTGLYLVALLWRSFRRDIRHAAGRRLWILRSVVLLLGAALPLGFLLHYNITNFGGPFELSMYHVDLTRWPNAESFQTQFSTPLRVGLPALLWYEFPGKGPELTNQGLLTLQPVTWLAVAGIPLLLRRAWQERRLARALMPLAIFTSYLLLYSSYSIYNPSSNDSRNLTPFLPLLMIAAGAALEAYLARIQAGRPLPLLGLLISGVMLLSFRNMLWHIAFFWGHDFDISVIAPWSISPENLRLVAGAVFANWANLPLIWLLAATGGLLGLLLWRAGVPASIPSTAAREREW